MLETWWFVSLKDVSMVLYFVKMVSDFHGENYFIATKTKLLKPEIMRETSELLINWSAKRKALDRRCKRVYGIFCFAVS